MSYYTGQGDYYSGKGDPGLFGFLGGVVKKVAGVASAVLPGPLGLGAGLINRAFGRPQQPARAITPQLRLPVGAPVPGIRGTLQRAIPGGATGVVGGMGGCEPGYHLNKAYSYRFQAEPGTMCVRNRSMNSANPKALRRAIRREKAFIGLAKSALKGTGWRMTKQSASRSRRGGGRHRH